MREVNDYVNITGQFEEQIARWLNKMVVYLSPGRHGTFFICTLSCLIKNLDLCTANILL